MIIGVTGGIAAGKTTVARLFEEKGALLLDADVIARRVIEEGTPAFKKIVRYFGSGILKKNGAIDRRRLADIAFSSPPELKKLNAFIHPEVIKIINAEIKNRKEKKVIVIDAPLLIEAGLHRKSDRVVVVTCSRLTQLKRLLKRDKMPPGEAKIRIRSQMPLRDKIKFADEVVDGELSLKAIRARINQIWEKFLSP